MRESCSPSLQETISMRLFAYTPVCAALASSFAFAAPIATLDRNGAYVSVEAYGPNVLHVTIAADKAEVLKGPGYGVLAKNGDNGAFRHTTGQNGDVFSSAAMTMPQPTPSPCSHAP